jgi:hypothetical protein
MSTVSSLLSFMDLVEEDKREALIGECGSLSRQHSLIYSVFAASPTSVFCDRQVVLTTHLPINVITARRRWLELHGYIECVGLMRSVVTNKLVQHYKIKQR